MYCWNELLPRVLNFKTPYELLYTRQLDYSFFRVFGCLSEIKINKLLLISVSCVFLGYTSQHIGNLCLDPRSGRLISIDMSFFMRMSFLIITIHLILVIDLNRWYTFPIIFSLSIISFKPLFEPTKPIASRPIASHPSHDIAPSSSISQP